MPSVEFGSRQLEGSPMVVHYVEDDGNSLLMAGIDEGLQIVWAAIFVVVNGILVGWRVRISVDTIKLSDRQQFHCVEAEIDDFA